MFRSKFTILAISILAVTSVVSAQPATTSAADFLRSVVGDWIGTYEHVVDAEPAEETYFKVAVRQAGQDTFTSNFSYFRLNEATGESEPAGNALVQSTIQPDGTVKNIITGEGTILVEGKPKEQTYNLVETLCGSDCGGLSGTINGKLSVAGLPLGVGKNGKINNGTSTWTVNGDTLTIKQTLKAGFKVLMFSKSYSLEASSKATRGTDLASLMKKSRVAEGL